MPRAFFAVALAAVLFCAHPLAAQKEKREPLTSAQVEEIREAAIQPDLRIQLYTKYLNERAQTLKSLAAHGHSRARAARLDEELLDFTALLDECASNLDMYGERHADLRRSLKKLNEEAPHWLETLSALASEPAFEISQKEAQLSAKDLAEQTETLLKEQQAYFLEHKDEKDQERKEPVEK